MYYYSINLGQICATDSKLIVRKHYLIGSEEKEFDIESAGWKILSLIRHKKNEINQQQTLEFVFNNHKKLNL